MLQILKKLHDFAENGAKNGCENIKAREWCRDTFVELEKQLTHSIPDVFEFSRFYAFLK